MTRMPGHSQSNNPAAGTLAPVLGQAGGCQRQPEPKDTGTVTASENLKDNPPGHYPHRAGGAAPRQTRIALPCHNSFESRATRRIRAASQNIGAPGPQPSPARPLCQWHARTSVCRGGALRFTLIGL